MSQPDNDGTFARTGIQSEIEVDNDAYAQSSGRRFKETLARIPAIREPALDMGPPNAFAGILEKEHNVRLEGTGHHDLDRVRLPEVLPGPYATITSFEILEHLLNPLFVLEGCREILQPDGALLVTVPQRNSWEWLYGKSAEHFHEFAEDEIRWVLEKAGFTIVKYEAFNSTGVGFRGVRPFLRGMLKNLIYLECRLTG